jgi:peptide/nickel transport system permease protein
MTAYVIRRLFIGAFTLLLITFLVYGLIRNMPGTPLTLDAGERDPSQQITERDYELLKKAYGLDKPWYTAYFYWLGNLAQLDLGQGIRDRKPVTEIIGQRMGPTLLLSVSSIAIAYALSIPIGLYCSTHSGALRERFISIVLYMLYSLPSYVAALQLLYLFYVRLQDTPFQLSPGMTSNNFGELSPLGKTGDVLAHLALPLVCFTYSSLAYESRFVKANMEEALRQDYVRTARAKGAGNRAIVWHAFRNTLIPMVTLLGLMLPSLLSGSIILEQIFNWPGMGQLFYESITLRDYPVIMGLTLMFSVLTLAGQLMADLLYAWVDPRITYS